MDGKTELVIFDLDGTLIDTAGEIAAATNDFLERQGWPEVGPDKVTRWIGRGTRALLALAIADATGEAPEHITNGADFRRYAAIFDHCYDTTCGSTSELFPGVRETLAGLHEAGVRLAVVTNKEHRYTTRILEARGIIEFFSPIISGDSLPTRKPDPAGAVACLAAHGVPAHQALFVGDSEVDACTARNAGVPVWLLPHGYNMGQPVAQASPDRIIADFAELRTALLPAPGQQARESEQTEVQAPVRESHGPAAGGRTR